MFRIAQVTDSGEKEQITLKIMHALPEFFSPPEDIDKKAVTHRDYPFFAAYDGEEPVGFVALKIHNEYTADMYNLGVLRAYHRRGIGKQLVKACIDYCRQNGFVYLTVKTLDSSAEYEPYERTLAFYKNEGFIPLEVFKTFWNEENPCLFLVKKI